MEKGKIILYSLILVSILLAFNVFMFTPIVLGNDNLQSSCQNHPWCEDTINKGVDDFGCVIWECPNPTDIKELALRLNRIELLDGDANADGKVDIMDLATIGLNFGKTNNDKDWNWKVDVANTINKIDIFDLAEVGLNYGEDYREFIDDPVFIHPPVKTVFQNEEFSVDVNVSTQANVYSVDFTLSFDPEILQVIKVKEGDFLSKDGASTFPIISFNNTKGEIKFANTRFGTATGVSGNGSLAEIKFKSLSKIGISPLDFIELTLVDPSLNDISISTENGTINVIECKKDEDCDDSIDCTVDTCNLQTGKCEYTPDDSLCDDSLFCNGEEYCDAELGCQAGTPIDCSPFNIPLSLQLVTKKLIPVQLEMKR